MWEITLHGEYDDVVYLLEMEKTLKDNLKKDIVSVIWITEDIICNLAGANDRNTKYIKGIISETILKIAKTKFFQENLNISVCDTSIFTFLISSLVIVDIDEEIDFIANIIDSMTYVDINAFINFKLMSLKDKWSYLIHYINNTYRGNHEDNVYLDFLKFLSDLQTPKYDVLYLERNNGYLELLNKKHEKLKKFDNSDEIGVIVQLIILCPKKIIISCIDHLSEKVSSLMNYIFDEKVSYLL